MKLLELKLLNFRQFKNEQIIEFSIDDKANLTLILGDNTSGKTTLLQAFLWCLYGKVNFKNQNLLNQEILADLESGNQGESVFVEVELKFLYRENEYLVNRKKEYKFVNGIIKSDIKDIPSMSIKSGDGNTASLETFEIKSTIEEILPSDLSTYFFYDTERFGNVTTKEDVTEAVKSLLGLSALEQAVEDLGTTGRNGTVIKKFYEQINHSNNDSLRNFQVEIENIEEEKEGLTKELKQVKDEIINFKSLRDEISKKLLELEETMLIQKEIDEKEKQLELLESNLENFEHGFYDNVNKNPYSYMLGHIIKIAREELKNANLDDKGIKDMTSDSIRDIILRQKCVCGTVVRENTPVYNHLLTEMKYLPPESIGNLISNFLKQASSFENQCENYFVNLTHASTIYSTQQNKIYSLRDEIDEHREDIAGKESAEQYANSFAEYTKKIEELNKREGAIESKIEIKTNELNTKNSQYKNYLSSDNSNKLVRKQVAYAEAVRDYIKDYLGSKVLTIREDLEQRVNRYFKRMYHGERKVVIDDKYRVTLKSTVHGNDIATDESKGLETVKNFSFISGLVDLTKNTINDRQNELDDTINEDYPLILDAPFSNTDDTHVRNISMVLPEVASQLILIVMDKDWNYAATEMHGVIGKQYRLNKKSEVYTEIIKEGE